MPQRVTASPKERLTPSRVASHTACSRSRSAQRCSNDGSIPTSAPRATDLRRAFSGWLADGKAQGWSKRTIDDRKKAMERFCWWLENEAKVEPNLASLSPLVLREFLTYAREPRDGGRYGSQRSTAQREARPATVSAYYRILRAFLNFCREEELLQETPLKNVKAPKVPTDQIQPLSGDQVQTLLDAARRLEAPERNVALILLLVDTGMRVSEAMRLQIKDVDRGTGELTVLGKGNKKRTVYMGSTARRALWKYLETDRRTAQPDDPLFVSVGGTKSRTALAYTGMYEVVRKAGAAAGLPEDLRSSPHTLRHTFAVNFLRAGRNLFELQQLMGHTDLTVLRRYVALAQADLAEAHRAGSPADRLRLK